MAAYPISVLGFGDNVVDKYEHIKLSPGGNAVNCRLRRSSVSIAAYMESSDQMRRPSTL
ncbi:MAG: hypothetical protein ACLU0O_08740 [Collinsella sp.]